MALIVPASFKFFFFSPGINNTGCVKATPTLYKMFKIELKMSHSPLLIKDGSQAESLLCCLPHFTTGPVYRSALLIEHLPDVHTFTSWCI